MAVIGRANARLLGSLAGILATIGGSLIGQTAYFHPVCQNANMRQSSGHT
jgi:hypothetical protein